MTSDSIEDQPYKVFCGNLAFKTTEDELKEFFSQAGTVVKVNIITRGTRSLGYGFVAFTSDAECNAAVEKCHKKELGGREINIEVAKPKAELAAARKERAAARAAVRAEKGAPPRRRRFFRKRKPGVKGSGEPRQTETEDGVIVSHGDKKDGDAAKGKKKRKPKKKKPADAIEGDSAPAAEKKPRQRRVPTGEPSKTTVFVANLPFSLDDAGLAGVFAEHKVKSAKVVIRRGSGRSKGFGFVEFESEEEQKKVLDGKIFTSEGRELNIKVALSDEKPEGTEEKKE